MSFDLAAHHRERTRRAEQYADSLERQRARHERLLALALQIAAGTDCDPLVLLRLLEETLDAADRQPSEFSVDELVQLLRDTDPAKIGRAA